MNYTPYKTCQQCHYSGGYGNNCALFSKKTHPMNLLSDKCIAEVANQQDWLDWQRLPGEDNYIVIVLRKHPPNEFVTHIYNHALGGAYSGGIYFEELESAIAGFNSRVLSYLVR